MMRLPRLVQALVSITFLIFTTLLGATFGWVAEKTLYWGSESVAVLAIDFGRTGSDQAQLRFPNIIEYLKSPSFAEDVALEANLPQLVDLLPSSEFGGENALSARQLRDTDEIELRVRMADPAMPQGVLTAVTNTLMKKLEAARASELQSQEIKWLTDDLKKTQILEEAIYLRLLRDLSNNSRSFSEVNLLDSFLQQRNLRLDLYQKLLVARGENGKTTGPAVVMEPTPAIGILESTNKTIGLGAIGGLCTGILTLLGWMTRRNEIQNAKKDEIDRP